MSNILEAMRNDYKDDTEIINKLTNTLDSVVDLAEHGMVNMSL